MLKAMVYGKLLRVLRRLEGWTPRSTSCILSKKTKSTPSCLSLLPPLSLSCFSFPVVAHQHLLSSPTGSPQRPQIRWPSPLEKQNQPYTPRSTPALTSFVLLISCRSAPTPGILPYREPPMAADPATLSPTWRDPWSKSEIHSPPTRSMEVTRWCCREVDDSPPWRGALPTLGDVVSHPSDRAPPTPVAMALLVSHPPPSPPSQAQYWRRWWSCATDSDSDD
jgi:hypothetical protein